MKTKRLAMGAGEGNCAALRRARDRRQPALEDET